MATASSPKKSSTSKAASAVSAKDAPLITVNNPLSYMYYWLDDVKNWIKKDSNGEIRIHIPFKWFVTALLIFMAGGAVPAYWQGKAVEYTWWITKPTPTPIIIVEPTLTPAPVLITRLGIIKATYQVKNLLPSPTPTPVASSSADLSSDASRYMIQASSESATGEPVRYVLMTDTYKLIYLKMPADVSLQKYIGYKALVTGLYTSSTNTLSLLNMSDIEVLY